MTGLANKLTLLRQLDAEIVQITPEKDLEDEIGRADEYSEKIQLVNLTILMRHMVTYPPEDQSTWCHIICMFLDLG